MQNNQLIYDLCTINKIKFLTFNSNSSNELTHLNEKLSNRKKIGLISDNEYKYIIIKKDKLFIFGPFEKENLLIIDNAKLFYFILFNKPYNKKDFTEINLNIYLEKHLIEIKDTTSLPYEINIIDFFEECIKNGDIEAAKLYIKIMFKSIYNRESNIEDFRLQKNLVIYIFSFIFSTIENNNIDPDFNVFLTSIITSEFEFCDNSSQLLLKTYQLLDKISDSFDFNSIKNNQKIREAKYYINNNLEKKLTLEKVANEMGISAKYLSTLFFEVTNTTFKEYVNRQRIDKAKNLLSYSNKSLSEISNQIGINSPNNFISFFKKYTQSTPNSFREQLKTD
ncbi:MAG: helix-turn-helix transcriptional regulator [Pleomorphochaeta sp.]